MKVTLHDWHEKVQGVTEEHWVELESFRALSSSVVRIQSWWRGYVARREALGEIIMRNICAIRIQTAWRTKAGKLALRRLIRLRALTVGVVHHRMSVPVILLLMGMRCVMFWA